MAVKSLEIIMLFGYLFLPIIFCLPIINYVYESTPLMGAHSLNTASLILTIIVIGGE
jgi:hypothetical protein